MEAFNTLSGITVPFDKINVDTDQIIPKQFLKKIERTGFGVHLFHDWRYIDNEGTKSNSEFILNYPRYQGSQILLTGENFGCGSSREHAPIALKAAGVNAIIAPTFARIFYRNAFNMGLPIFELEESAEIKEGHDVKVDMDAGTITNITTNKEYKFTPIPPFMQELISCGGLMEFAKKEAEEVQ